MTPVWVTRHRRSLTVTGAALLLILAGRFAHGGVTIRAATYGFVPWDFAFGWVSAVRLAFGCVLALALVQVATLILGSVRGLAGNGKASLGQGIAFSSVLWLASDKAEFDWRALRITGYVLGGLLVASYLPPIVWAQCVYAGAAILVGQVLGVFWTDLFTATPAWGRYVPWLAGTEAQHIPEPDRNDYWRDAKSIKKGWGKLMQDMNSKLENAGQGPKVKAPKLIGDPAVDKRSISLTVEPPPQWSWKGVSQLAGILTNEWNGVQSQVIEAPADRMARRRMRIDIAMEPLPTSVPYPIGDMDDGVPLGVGLMGDVLRLEVGPRGVPHVLVAGQAGSGKSSAMRVMGLGLTARGARVKCIDPKGEGDLEGISPEPTLYRPQEWAEWFDFLWDEQRRRAEIKRQGGEPGPPIVTMIDELAQIATKMGARDKTDADQLVAAHQAYMRLIFIGRGTGLHIISATQQASAQNLGGKDQGTAIRAQHLGRILFGRGAEAENRNMVLGDRLVTEQDVEKMQSAPPGRAWVSGMTPRDTGMVHAVQFYDVPEMAGAAGAPVLEPVTPTPTQPIRVDTEPASGEDVALRFLVADAVHSEGSMERAVLCDRFGVPVTSMRHTLRKCEAAGWVRCESPGGNRPVVVHPVGEWPPPDHA